MDQLKDQNLYLVSGNKEGCMELVVREDRQTCSGVERFVGQAGQFK